VLVWVTGLILYIPYYIAKSLNNFGLKGIILFFGGLKEADQNQAD
jgi:hypothetical protein